MEPIATIVSSALMVLSKYALKRGTEVAAKVSKEAIILAAELLKTVRTYFETQTGEKAQKALINYIDNPEDYETVFETYLKQELEANEAFRQEIVALLKRFQTTAPKAGISITVSGSGAFASQGGIAAGESGVAVEGDVEGGIHIGRSG